MVIVMVALAEELLALLILLVTSLSGMLLSVGKVSDITDAGNLAIIITSTTRAIKRISLFTISLSLYALFA